MVGQLRRFGIASDIRGETIDVSYEGSVAWIGLDSDGELKREYKPDEQRLIESLIGDWRGYSIDYRSLSVADAVVAAWRERWPCVVDDEDEFFGGGVDYLRRRRDDGYVPHAT